jgi:glycosyl transferase, family 25
MGFFDNFEMTRIISLADREDRRRDLGRNVEDVFGAPLNLSEELFIATRPEAPGPFENIGTRGCFESHLAVLREAREQDAASILILEDDAAFSSGTAEALDRAASELTDWDCATFGHSDPHGDAAALGLSGRGPEWVRLEGSITRCHCVAFSRRGIARVVEHLEQLQAGEPGDHLRGPMPVDGAYNTLTWIDPKFRRLVLLPSLVGQRSSRSDITPSAIDRSPLRPFAAVGRRLLRRLRER